MCSSDLASEGMLDMLQIMKIDTVMPYYPTRKEALEGVRKSRL